MHVLNSRIGRTCSSIMSTLICSESECITHIYTLLRTTTFVPPPLLLILQAIPKYYLFTETGWGHLYPFHICNSMFDQEQQCIPRDKVQTCLGFRKVISIHLWIMPKVREKKCFLHFFPWYSGHQKFPPCTKTQCYRMINLRNKGINVDLWIFFKLWWFFATKIFSFINFWLLLKIKMAKMVLLRLKIA